MVLEVDRTDNHQSHRKPINEADYRLIYQHKWLWKRTMSSLKAIENPDTHLISEVGEVERQSGIHIINQPLNILKFFWHK